MNGPSATIVSGPIAEVTHLQHQLVAHNVRSRILSVPFTLARAATFAEPKFPVASTLLASVIGMKGTPNGMDGTSSGVSRTFSADYLAEQTRQTVDFVGRRTWRHPLGAIKSKLNFPIWLEIGPSRVCDSFVRTTLSPSPSKIM